MRIAIIALIRGRKKNREQKPQTGNFSNALKCFSYYLPVENIAFQIFRAYV